MIEDRKKYVISRHGRKLWCESGFRYGRWTVLDRVECDVLVQCDCGEVRQRTTASIVGGASTSCGCRRREVSRGMMLEASPKWVKENWANGTYSHDQASEVMRANNEKQKGQPAIGRGAKGLKHHAAKHYVVRGPAGQIIDGMNLSHMVRTHTHLFAPGDVAVRRNKYGTEIDCKAMRGIRGLFNRPGKSKVPRSWKGWVAVSGPRDE